VLCCMDYSVKHKLGNLLLNDYYELFSNVGISELHAENMKFGQGDSLCKTCSRARPHDVGDTKQYWKAQ
jgi:hypothetical protein